MDKRIRVPIRVGQPRHGSAEVAANEKPAVAEPTPPVVEEPAVAEEKSGSQAPARPKQEEVSPPSPPGADKAELLREELETWRDRALRLQAEMENFRKRQQRLASEQIQANRARLLRNFLSVVDDLERALRAEGDEATLREGVVITHRSLMQLLRQEGIEQIQAEGESFDPHWHEAVGTVPHREVDVDRDTVVEVTREGYRLDDRLLRPARVIVAR